MKPLRILLFLLLLCRSSTLGDDDDRDDDDDGGEPLKKMSLKDYRALVAPNNDDYFYATKYRTDWDLFHCINPSSGRYCLDDMSSCAFTEAEEAGSEYDSGLTSLQNTERNFGNDGVFNISRRRRVQVTYISLPCLSRQERNAANEYGSGGPVRVWRGPRASRPGPRPPPSFRPWAEEWPCPSQTAPRGLTASGRACALA